MGRFDFYKKVIVCDVYAIVSCARTNITVTAVDPAYPVIDWTDMLLNISDFPSGARGVLRVTWMNSVAANRNRNQLTDQFGPPANNPVAGSEVSGVGAGTAWEITESSPFTLPAGLKSFQIRGKVMVASTMTIAKVELQIEKG